MSYFTNGKLQQQINRIYIDSTDKKNALARAVAIKNFIEAMCKYYGDNIFSYSNKF